MFEGASKVLPGGGGASNQCMKPYPIYIKYAKGKYLVDVDGNEYIDFHLGAGPQILGHSPPVVVEALKNILSEGFQYQLANENEVELAERIVNDVPSMEMLRFCNSGTEAVMIAMRLARAYTKRDKIAVFEGHYDGQEDYALISGSVGSMRGLPNQAGPSDKPNKLFDSAGIPKAIMDTVEVLPYNNIEATESLINKHADELAAVIIEPILGMGGCIPADVEFLKAIRELTQDKGIVLIFDEVMTGFRIKLGGAQEYYGVTPDMTTLGKIVGGGLPIGVYGGRKDIMENLIAGTFGSGTYSGNPITCTAGLAMTKELEKGEVYLHLDRLSEKIKSGVADIASKLKIDFQVIGLGSMFQFHFTDKHIKNRRDLFPLDKRIFEFHQRLLGKGIWMHMVHPFYTCAVHTDKDVEKLLTVSEDCLKKIK